ncbi:Ig-like domain-containing protein [Shewanella xiamenensis]|uniref:Ig-like domain-containing protein n=4 Tax=Shewanella xiamenensis TaxID=332186 RepID=UPI0008499238|nr:Ig-like domain-containing protein [Shewanella xiamenensis]ODR85618.1 adhesin [Shewanella xiamenensis]
MGSVITSKKGLLKLVNGQINIEVDGSKQPAKDGEQLPKGAVLHIGENATYEITFDDGTKLSNEAAPAITAATPTNAEATPDEIQALQDLIASGEDPTKNLPETAAGNAPASDGNSGYVSLARDGAEAIATSGYSTSGQTLAAIASNTPDQSIATDSPSVLANDSITVDEDTVATGNVLNNDTDADTILSVVSFSVEGTSFTAGSTVTLEGGSLVINADGSYTFTPNENWNGQVPVITYTTNTGSTATLTINITPVDDPSVLANDTNTVDENTVATGNVLDNDSDVDNELSVASFTVNGQTVAAGTTVTLEGGSLVINADGSYTFTPNEFWNGQVPVITYTTNTGSTATLTINITPVANGGPSVTITTDTNNDGFISNEELGGATEVNVTIGLEGTGANAGDTLTVNGVDYILTQEDIDNGFVNLTLPAPAEGETITVVATITDAAGNTSPEGSDSAVLDTTGPVITVSAPDDTQDTTPTITGTTDAPPGSTITIVVTDSTGAQQTLTTTVNPDGTYSVDVTNPIAEGGYTAEASVTDPAGNTGKASDNGSVDTKIDQDGDGNTVAITAITEDTGSSSSDFITNDNTLIFKGTVDLDDNSTLAVTINGTTYTVGSGLVIDAQGNWSVDLTGTVLPDGTYPVSATVTDAAGNSKTVTQDVVIDTKIDQDGDGNTVAITAITEDTGSSSSDFITNDNTLIFKGTVDLDDNSTLAVTINGTTYTVGSGLVIDAQGNWSVDLTGTVLPDGTYPVSATVTDAAGNSKTVTQDVVIDTKIDQDGDGNTVAITAITEDTGSSSSDFITNDNTLIFKGTVDLDDNSTLAVTINGTTYTVGSGLVIDAQGNWSVDLTGTVLPDGTYPVSATVTDAAGNSKTVTQDVVIDTKIDQDGDGNTVAITAITEDTGSSSSDFITNDNTLIFKGTVDLDDNSTLAVTINGTTYTVGSGLVIDAQGNWSVDLTGTVLPDGTYPVSATVTDAAGNSKTVTQDVVIDTKIDQDGDGNTVAITAITEDTGSSSSDFITNDNTLIFKGTVDLDDNSTLAVTINGTTYTVGSGLVIDAQGNWSVDLTGTVLPDGTYPVSATVTDAAGNSKTVTQDVVIDTKIDQDGDGNTVAITAITEDTGSSSSDFITNDNTLIFKGTVDLDDNSTLAVTINGTTYTVGSGLVIDAQGNWSVDLTGTVLPDGTYPVSATVTDAAGNSKTVTQDVVIDTKIDQDGDGNTVAITAITEDTGSSSSDFITNDNTLIFKGTVDLDDNSTLAVTINGTTYTVGSGLVIDAQGNWSVDLTGTVLPDGTYPVSATVTDAAGNSKTVTQDVVIDTKIDQDGDGNTVAITAITEDTGSSSSDFITNDNTLIFKGTVDLDDNSTLAVTINGTTYTVGSGLVIDAQGNWSVDLTGTVLPDGTYPVSATVTDAAGNSKTVTQDVVIDTKIDQDGDGNTVAITAITEDTGSSSSDFITNDNTLIFKGTVDLDDNSTLAVTINGTTYTVGSGLVIDAQGNWSVDLTGTVLPDGTYPVSATVTDAAGNSKTVTQDVVIDTKIDQDGDGNTVAITAITEDTGSSSSDFITNDNTLIFKGTVDLDDNSTLAVTINGTTYTVGSGLVIDAQGNWSVDLTGTVLPDGTYPVSATVTDAAGNSKTVTQDVVIDTKIDQDGDGNTVAITAITEDTGSSSSDFITNDNTLIFKGTVDLDDNSTLAVTINGTTYTVGSGLVIDAQGNWSVDLTGTVLPDGTYPVSATVTDAAGNSKTVTQDVVIDTKIDQDGDGNTVAITAITEDTGSSSSDFITNDNTLIFKGTVDLDDNSTLAVTINGTTYTVGSGLVIDAQGNWSVDLTGTVLPDGTYPVSATVTDAAGNSKTVTQDVVIDTKIDQDGDGNTVAITAITEDTGSSSSDFITNDNTLIFKGTVDLDDNSTLAVTINGTTYTVGSGLVIDAQGNWSVDLTGTVLPDGTYPVSATVTDAAGNSKTVTQDVVIDTKIDQDGDGNTVAITAITEDTGSSSSDFITNDNTLIFKGTVDLDDNSTLAVTINGTTYTVGSGLVIDAQGNWSVDLTGTVLPDGTYPVSATVTDAAGNSKTVTQDVVIDTKIDQDGDGNTVAITAITEDTGSSSSDFITNDNTLIFKGTVDLDDNSTLAVTINGTTYTVGSGLVIDAQGNWSVDLTGTVLPDGTYPVSATVTDAAGNSKTVTQDVVIDTKIDQDGDGNTVAITAITEDTGSSSSDFITNDNTLIFKGTVDLDDNSTLAVTINGTTYTVGSGLVIDAQGNWSVDLTGTVLPDGTYPVSATVTDAAGNSKTVTQDVVIDTKIDQDGDGNTVAITAITEDTGSSSSDFITNDNTLIFKGTVDLDDNSTLAVTINGTTYTVGSGLVIDAQGNWSVDLTGTVLPDGTYPVSATVTDAAGNSKTVTQDVVIDTKIDQDGDGNTVAITAITEDTGSSSSDFITNDNTLIFKGTVDLDDNSTLAVTINGTTYTVGSGLVIDAQGNWSVDLTGTVLPDGTYPVSATVTDAAGNSKTVTQDVVIDTKIDQDGDGNTVAITAITEDTGSSSSDFITNDNTLIFKGTVDLDDNSTLAVTINGTTYTVGSGLVIDAQGNWSVDLTGTVLPDGTYPVSATVTDAAGNSKTVTQDVVIDTKIDQDGDGNTVAITAITEDTGSSSSDFITNDNTLIFKGTVDLDDNSTLAVTINGTTYTVGSGLVIDAQGNWSVDLTGTVLPDGTYPVSATVTDAAGNSKTVTQDVVIDTKIDQDGDGNTVAITAITEDTGSSSSDFITNDNTLIFKGTVDLDDNSTLAVTINGTTYTVGSGLVIDAQGNWSVDLTGTVLPDGTYPVSATVTDAAGNSKTVTQDVVIDTKIDQDGDGNTVAITAITEDTGSSSSDFITNDNTLIFKGTVDLDDNSTLAVTINGTTYTVGSGLVIDAQGNWSVDLTGTVLPDGTYPVSATVTDAAGNSKTVTQDVVIDTKIDQDGDGNTVAITAITEDTGSSSSDFITNDNTLIFKGTVDLDDNSTLAVTINGTTYTVGSGLVIDAQGNWSVDLTGTVLPDGTYPVSATVTDAAGNSKTVTQDVVIDTKIDQDGDGNTVAITAITEDTGSSSSDFITNDNTLIFKGTVDLDDNSTLAVTINGTTYTVGSGLVIDAQGNWSVDLTGTVLPDGTYPVSATVTDAAGNSKTVTQDVVIDTKIDQDGDGNTVAITAITEDTGSSSSDFITNDNTLIFKGTVDLDDNSTLAVTINGTTYTVGSGLVIDAQGNWSVDLTGTVLPDGTYPVSATVTDAAGNSKTVTQDVVIDTKIDQDGDGNTVAITAITEDTGSSSSDFITNDNTLIFKGTVDLDDNSTLAVTINGTTYTVGSGLVIDAQGNWSVDLTGTVLPDGTYPVSATVTDAAGNSKTVTQDVVIDTKIDQDGDGNTVAITAITEDTGSSSSDFITNDNTLIFKGTVDLDDNSTLAVTINGTTYTVGSGLVIDAQGNWSVDLTGTVLPDGTYPVSATVTDAAGNSKTVTQDVVIDTKIDQDGDGNTVAITAITEDTGSSSSDFITNDNTLIFKGTVDLDDNSTLAVTINGTTYTVGSGLVIDAQGNWSVDLTGTVLPDGTYPVSATVTDAAGNSKTVTQDVVIDTNAPVVNLTITEDTNNDGLLSSAELSGQVNYQVTLGAGTSIGDTLVIVDQDGNELFNGTVTLDMLNNGLSLAVDAPDEGKTLILTATVTDPAGNTDNASDVVTIDTTAPTAPTVLIVDDANPDDGLLTQGEINSNGAGVQLTVSINGTDFEAGGYVTLTINGGAAIELSFADFTDNGTGTLTFGNYTYANGVISWTETAPADGQSITVTATQTDKAGNTSAEGSDTALVDTTAPTAPTVLIVDDANPDDGLLTQGEINSNGAGVQLTVSINGTDFEAGGYVTLTINGGAAIELSFADFTDNGTGTLTFGNYTYANGVISWTETAPADGQSITVTATQTDKAGNTSAEGSDTALVDTTAPTAPTVLIVDDANPDDGLLTQGEINSNGAGVQLTVSINGTDFEAGGYVTLTINGGAAIELSFADFTDNGTGTLTFGNYTYANGVISWTETAPADGQSITVTATQTDKAGNTSAEGSDTALVDTTAPTAPTVLIVDDANPDDGLLTQGEINSNGAGVQLTVSINGTDFEAGGYVTLTINGGAAIELSFADFTDNGTGTLTFGNYTYANGVISWTETAPADGQSITVTATQTDKAGNTSAEGSDTALVDTTAPTAPTVLIVDDANPDDGLLTQGEINSNGAGVQLTVSINGTDFEAGGYVTLTINGGAAIELSFADFTDNGTGTLTFGNYTYANGVISWTETAPADGQSITVTATQTDKAGNTSAEGSDTALVDTTAPTAPTVLIVDDANPDDGLLTQGEINSNGAGVQLTVSINGTDFEAGGYVTLTINGGAAIELSFADFTDNGTGTLTFGNYTYANGVISWTETAPADGQSITVTATQTDKAGNTSAEGSDTALVDTTAPTAPTVLIVDDANPDDGLLTQGEINSNGAGVQLTVSINGTDFEAGGYVTLTINGGAAIELSFADFTDNGTGTLTFGNYTYANGVISWTETAPADGQSITVTATQTDKAGNTSAEGSDTALVDTTAPTAPTVLIVDDANPDDGLLTQGEINSNGAGVQLTVSINGTDFEAGGYVTLTINGGAAIELSFADFTDNGTGTLTFGNYTYANGVISWTETAPADGQSITVTATQTDKAGNTSAEGSDTALVDTTAPTAPTVLIVDDANPDDGLLTQGEINSNGAGVQLTVSINGTDFEAGGYVTLTINGGAAIELSFADFTDNGTGTLTFGNYTYANGVISWTETAPADGQSITVTATQTDKAGNTSAEGSDTALVDTTAPTAPTVLIVDDANPDDGLLTQGEINSNGAGVQLTVSINGTDFEAGGYVTLTINGGAAIELSFADFTDNGTGTLTFGNYTYANGVISWTETAPADGQSITVTATQTDKAGNTSAEGSDTALVDTTAPTAPTVLIVDDANPDDGLLTQGEINSNGAGVQLTVSINGTDFEAGGYVTLTINGGAAIELSFADFTDNGTGTLTFGNYTYANGVISWTETAPADGQSITVTATQTDKAGNTSAEGSDTALVDTTAPTAPTVLIVDDANPDDGLLTQGEINSNGAGVQLTVSINGTDFEAGGYVTLTINGGAAIELSFADFTDNGTGTLTFGNYTYANGVISWTETAPADGQSITVTATQTDKAGNTSAEGSDTALVDTTAPTAPTVLIVDDANPDDGLLTQGEINSNGAGVQLTVSINGTDFEAGGYVTLTINGGAAIELSFADFTDNGTGTLTFGNYTYANGVISWTETRPADGALLKVEATQTDKAGNTSDKGSDQATVIYTSDDSFTKQEDQLVTGQLLTNDHSSNTSIVSFTVMYNGTLTSFNAGQTVALSIGSLLIQANGEFKFIPNQHWSGDVSTVTYTTNTGDTATLNITVQPVADKPLVDVILTANGTPLYSGFISSGITTEQFRNGDFTHQPFNTGAKQTDASSGQDTVYGSNGNDHIVSTNGGGDHLLGYAGNDVLVGGDAIQGDTINGGIGNDILVAGLGQDSLYGGEGNDIAVLMGNRADYIITKDYRYSQWDNWFNFTTIEHGQTITKALHDIEYIQFDDGIYELDKNTGELVMVQPTYVDYPVEIHASLTDRDGSELLDSIELSGLPAGTQVFYNGQLLGVADNDGKLLLDYDGPDGWTGGNLWAENALDATLTGVTIRVPGTSAGQVDLVVEAVAREKGTDLTNSATGEDTIRLDYFKGTEGEPGDQNVNFGSEHNIVVGDLDGSIVLPGQNYNIAFMVDSSGSINADTLETMKLQLAQVLETLKDSASGQQSGTVKIFLVDFDTHAKGSISVDLSDPNALDILQDALDDMSSGGGTNYEDVFTTTANWFANGDAQNNSGATNLAFFITDGKPTYYNAVPGGNPLVYDTWGSNNDRSLSQLIGSGYVFGQVYTVNGHVVIDENGNVFSVDVFNSVSRSPVGAMRPDAQGNYQYYALAGNGRDSSADTISNSQAGFALLSSLGVTVQAIGMGSNIDEDDLLPYDSDDNVQTNVDADDLADAILGDQVNAIPGADRFDGGAGDDVIFGDAIHFTGISGQGFAAIKAYVADKLGIADASDAQVHRYISEHSDEFDQSGANDKADIILGGAGNDILFGQGGNDYLDGGAGKDTLYGGNGNDTLIGGAGNDTLIGGAGNDTLIGGLGDDVLRGDSGNDTFVWRYADADKGTDHIMDFNVSEDKLDLSDLLQGETAGTLESYLNFSLDSNGSTVIDIDANKDGVFDQHIVLDGVNLFSQYSATDNAGVINGLLGTNGNGPLIIDAAPVTPDAPQGVTSLIDPHNNNGTIIP